MRDSYKDVRDTLLDRVVQFLGIVGVYEIPFRPVNVSVSEAVSKKSGNGLTHCAARCTYSCNRTGGPPGIVRLRNEIHGLSPLRRDYGRPPAPPSGKVLPASQQSDRCMSRRTFPADYGRDSS